MSDNAPREFVCMDCGQRVFAPIRIDALDRCAVCRFVLLQPWPERPRLRALLGLNRSAAGVDIDTTA